MRNDEKIRILKYFLLAEGLNPKMMDKKTPLDIPSNKVVFNSKNSVFENEILNAEQRLIIPPKNTCSLAIFGSLYPINNIQNKLNRFAKAFTPNAATGMGAGFVLSFEKIDFHDKSFIFDAIHKNVDFALSPLIASCIDENSDFDELYAMCSVDFLQTLKSGFIDKVQKEFLPKRTNYDNGDESDEQKDKHFYIKITSSEVKKLYQMLFRIYKEAINVDESFISDEIQIQILSSQKGAKLDTLMNSFYLQSLQKAIKLYLNEEYNNVLIDNFLDNSVRLGRIDLRSPGGISFCNQALKITEFPAGAYPFKASLNASQCFAINQVLKRFNLANKEDFDYTSGFYSINGAPGTGKTTILKDIIANIYVRRAIELANLEEHEIFKNNALNPALCGYDMLIISNNNKAVENVSKELCNPKDIAQNLQDELKKIDYFSLVATRALGKKSWGAFGLSLGNSNNISNFKFNMVYNKRKNQDESKNQKFNELVSLYPELLNESKDAIMGLREWIYKNKHGIKFDEAKEEFKQAINLYESFLDNENFDLDELNQKQFELSNQILECGQDDWHKIKHLQCELKEILEKIKTAKGTFNDKNNDNLGNNEFLLARQRVFLSALKLHKAAILSKYYEFNSSLMDFVALMTFDFKSPEHKKELLEKADDLWEAIFFIFGAVSSTFASFENCFRYKSKISTLLIEEAGQATLSSAIGALLKSQKAVVIGDPMQLEPVMSLPSEINDFLLRKCGVAKEFNLADSSVQNRADKIEPNGTMIRRLGAQFWIGTPLMIHKRCDKEVFDISNAIAYDNMMTWGKNENQGKLKNYWIDVPSPVTLNISKLTGNARKDEIIVLDKLLAIFYKNKISLNDIAVITPFVDVLNYSKGINKKYKVKISTIHTMQGRESKIVILVLGGPFEAARRWAAKKPNLLNVALTRASENFFVIGDFKAWSCLPHFHTLSQHILAINQNNIDEICLNIKL